MGPGKATATSFSSISGKVIDLGEWGKNVPQSVIDQVMAVHEQMGKRVHITRSYEPMNDIYGNEVLAPGETWTADGKVNRLRLRPPGN